MTQVGKRVTVTKSVVTGIRIEPFHGTLVVEGVDQDRNLNTLASHTLVYGDSGPLELPKDVAAAVKTIRDHAEAEVERA